MTITPPLLKKRDKVAIVAPSRMVTPDQIITAKQVFESWGLEVIEGKDLYSQYGYFAGTDDDRRNDLQQFINDPNIAAIFCARGGYGMTRMVDKIDVDPLIENPKWIIGFSDITALHLKLHLKNIESIHGLMPAQFGYSGVQESIVSLKKLLFEGKNEYSVTSHRFNRTGEVEAPLVGGNLSLIADSLGTSTEIDTAGKILVLEEVDEYLYKIDRMFTQLSRGNKLSRLAGIVVGDFSDSKDTQIAFGKTVHELIYDHVARFEYPVAFSFPIGHEALNIAIPLSRKTKLNVNDEGSLISF